MAQGITWPVKTREIHNVVFDFSVWNDFKFRADDIVIATWAKAGTTWTHRLSLNCCSPASRAFLSADMFPGLASRVGPPHPTSRKRHSGRSAALSRAKSPLTCRAIAPPAAPRSFDPAQASAWVPHSVCGMAGAVPEHLSGRGSPPYAWWG